MIHFDRVKLDSEAFKDNLLGMEKYKIIIRVGKEKSEYLIPIKDVETIDLDEQDNTIIFYSSKDDCNPGVIIAMFPFKHTIIIKSSFDGNKIEPATG